MSIYTRREQIRRKKLFDCYVELNCYRLAVAELYKHRLITQSDYRAVVRKIATAELDLITPKQAKTHPRTLTQVK